MNKPGEFIVRRVLPWSESFLCNWGRFVLRPNWLRNNDLAHSNSDHEGLEDRPGTYNNNNKIILLKDQPTFDE